MFWKLATLIVALGVLACVLLTVRQQRIQAAHELASIQRRVGDHDRTLWQLRVELAGRLSPKQIEMIATRTRSLQPIAHAIQAMVPMNDAVVRRDEQGRQP